MSKFSQVPGNMYDPNFRSTSKEAKLVELWIRTNEFRKTEGLFKFRLALVMEDMGLDREEIEEATKELERAGRPFIFDRENELVLDLDALRYNPIKQSDNRLRGAMKQLSDLPPTARPMMRELLKHARKHSPDLAVAMEELDLDDIELIETPSDVPSAPLQTPSEAPREFLVSPGGGEGVGGGDGIGGGEGGGDGDGVGRGTSWGAPPLVNPATATSVAAAFKEDLGFPVRAEESPPPHDSAAPFHASASRENHSPARQILIDSGLAGTKEDAGDTLTNGNPAPSAEESPPPATPLRPSTPPQTGDSSTKQLLDNIPRSERL